MRTTTDTLSGRVFRWNCTVVVDGLATPARESTRGLTWLDPSRVPAELLAELNPGAEGVTPDTSSSAVAH